MSNEEKNQDQEGFEVGELDDADLDDVAGGQMSVNNCDCTNSPCLE